MLLAVAVIAFNVGLTCGQDKKLDGKDLIDAARQGNLKKVEQALEQGVDVDSKTEYGATALSYASNRGHLKIVKLLIDNKADVNAKDSFYNATPITWASYEGQIEIVKLLLENGSNGADTVLLSAISSGNREMAKVAIDSGKVSESGMNRAKRMLKANPQEELASLFDDLNVDTKEGDSKNAPAYQPDPTHLAKLAGNYESENGLRLTFKIENNKLSAGNTDSSQFLPLNPVAKNKFENGTINVQFEWEGDKVSSVQWKAGNSTIALRPTAPADVASKAKPGTDTDAETPKAEFGPSSAASRAADLAISSPNWPQFRGNGARGVAEGQNPPVRFNAAQDDAPASYLLWKTPIPGLANSCPAIWGQRVFITTAVSEGDQAGLRTGNYGDVKSVEDDSVHSFEIYCLDKYSGEVIWKRVANRAVPKVKRHAKSTHANPTPATDGKHVIAFFGSEGLYCFTVDGELLWKKDLGKLDSGWFYDSGYQWGFGSSPVIYRDKVIVQCDIQDESFIAAYDLQSGSEMWRTKRDEIPSWSTPTVVSTSSGDLLVTNATRSARAYNPENGKQLWSFEGHSEIVVPTPFSAHDLIYLCSGYRPIQPIYAVKLDARGNLTLEKGKDSNDSIAWSKKRGGPYMPTPICYGDYLYLCSNDGVLTCLEARTGKRVYRTRISSPNSKSFVGSPVAADGHLYFPGETGYITVIKAGPKYEKVAENYVGENILSTPAISEGVIYIRGQNHVFAFGKTTR